MACRCEQTSGCAPCEFRQNAARDDSESCVRVTRRGGSGTSDCFMAPAPGEQRSGNVMAVVERYSVMLNGYRLVGAGLTRLEALDAALLVVDAEVSEEVRQVDIIEQATREKRARWRRNAAGWSVSSAADWLS